MTTMSILDIFKRRPDPFLQLLTQQAEQTRLGLEHLHRYMETHDPEAAAAVTQAEHDAD